MAALQSPHSIQGSELFDPSNLEFTSVDVGNPTVNLIPGEARARLQRIHATTTVTARPRSRCWSNTARATRRQGASATPSSGSRRDADVFVTKPGPFTDLAAAAIAEVTGHEPKLSTTGGTSDARFIKDYCPVLEFGLLGQTMHAVDERVPVADLVALTAVYRRIIEKYFE